MRAAAILAPAVPRAHLRPFRTDKSISWDGDLNDADAAMLFGGDGTVHRYLPVIVKQKLPLLVIPSGSGNDFASSLGIHSRRAALRAWQAFYRGARNVATIDIGRIRQSSAPEDEASEHYFCCSAYLGLDSATNALANRLPRFLRAHGGYVMSLFPTLLRFRAPRIYVRDSNGNTLHADPAMLTCFANTPRYGHGLHIAPEASLNDGLLDLCFVRRISKPTLLALFPIVYGGKHTSLPFVKMHRGRCFRMETETPANVFADGEYVCQTPVEITVLPQMLSVIVPEGHPLQCQKSNAQCQR